MFARRPCKVAQYFEGGREPSELITVEGVSVRLSGHKVLEGISFSLSEGSFMGIIGPNGAGKTTLLRLITGIIKPDAGTIRVMGMSPRELKQELHHIGYVPQAVRFDPLFPVTVFDVVMMGRICCIGPLRFPKKSDREAVREGIAIVGLEGLENRLIGELSGGQQKRAFLARALCRETRILLLDEPTAGVDIAGQAQFMNLLEELKKRLGLSIMFVSHDVNALANHADEVLCINRTVQMHGKADEVLGSDCLHDIYQSEGDLLVARSATRAGEEPDAGV